MTSQEWVLFLQDADDTLLYADIRNLYFNFFRKFKDALIKHVCEINQEIVNYLSILIVIT